MKKPTIVPACRVAKGIIFSGYFTCEPDMMKAVMMALSDSGAHLNKASSL